MRGYKIYLQLPRQQRHASVTTQSPGSTTWEFSQNMTIRRPYVDHPLLSSGGATPGRARSNALAKKLLPWLAPWLTEIFTFGPSQSSQLMTCLTTVLTWK